MEKYTLYLIQCIRLSLAQFLITCACISISWANDVSAQKLLDRRLTLQIRNEKVKTVLMTIETLVNVKFSYSPQLIQSNRKVSLQATGEPLGDVLNKLLSSPQLTYSVISNQIILKQIQKPVFSVAESNTINRLTISSAVADEIVAGTVTDEKGAVLPGVSVVVKGTQRGTITDAEGKYSLVISGPGVTLVYSFVGYLSKEVVMSSQSTIDVSLTPNDKTLEEVVVVGYGTQRRANVTGAIGSIRTADINNITTANSSALIQGKVAGVRVENAGGSPGAGVNVIVRGTGTFGNDQPLYVIDGNITTSMDFLNPNDIASIEILKDASAAAIYGNRAANGVVLVTTKQGSTGQTKINFSAKYGVQGPTHLLSFMKARAYADYINQAADNDGRPRALANTTAFDPNVDTDWQRLSIQSAPVQDYSLNLSGGNENAKFYISGQFFDQKGIVVNSGFKRYNLRANSTFTKGRFRLTEALSLSRGINTPNTYWGRERGEITDHTGIQ